MNDWIEYIPAMLMVLARVGGIFIVAPVFSEAAVPVRVRVFLAIAMSLAVVSRLPGPAEIAGGAGAFLAAVAFEALIGATIGYAARLVFAGVEFGAHHIGQQMGISLVEAFDPSGEAGGGAVRTLLRLLAIVIFLAIGGHRQMIAALLGTFDFVPAFGAAAPANILDTVTGLLEASFLLALKVAAPVLVAMLLATVATGMLQKTMPQVNILSVGFPMRAMVGLIVMAAGLAILPAAIETAWRGTSEELTKLLAQCTERDEWHTRVARLRCLQP